MFLQIDLEQNQPKERTKHYFNSSSDTFQGFPCSTLGKSLRGNKKTGVYVLACVPVVFF